MKPGDCWVIQQKVAPRIAADPQPFQRKGCRIDALILANDYENAALLLRNEKFSNKQNRLTHREKHDLDNVHDH